VPWIAWALIAVLALRSWIVSAVARGAAAGASGSGLMARRALRQIGGDDSAHHAQACRAPPPAASAASRACSSAIIAVLVLPARGAT